MVEQRADLLAKLGYVTLVVDLYNGEVTDHVETARRIQQKVDAPQAQKAIHAGFKLLTDSPRYKTNKIVLAAWSDNYALARAVTDSMVTLPLVGTSWLEPDRINILATLPPDRSPLQIIMIREAETGGFDQTMNAYDQRRGKQSEVFTYADRRGFLLQPDPSASSVEAWSSLITFWKKLTEGHYVAAPAPEALPIPPASSPEASPVKEPVPSDPIRPPTTRKHPRLR